MKAIQVLASTIVVVTAAAFAQSATPNPPHNANVYRVTYTFTDTDNNTDSNARADIRDKRARLAGLLKSESEKNPEVIRLRAEISAEESLKVGVQHYSVVVTESGRATLKNGSKIPVATGSYSAGSSTGSGVQTQFTYLDVGTNLDATVSAPINGTFQVKTKVERSSIAEDKTIAGVNEPVVRQSVLEVTSVLGLGKPQVIGTLDFTGSTRHLDVEVVLEAVK